MSAPNVLYDRYCFYQRCQQSQETLKAYVADVRQMAKTCDFKEYSESFVRDRIVFGMRNEEIKWRIIQSGGNPNVGDVMRAYIQHKHNLKTMVDEKVPTIEICELPVVVKMEFEDAPIIEPMYPVAEVISDSEHDEDSPPAVDTKPNVAKPAARILELEKPLSMAQYEKMPCPICAKLYAPISIRDHIWHQHPEADESATMKSCDICQKVMSYRSITSHMKRHIERMNNGGIACINCDMSFMSLRSLKTHIEKQHTTFDPDTNGKLYCCTHCNTSYNTCHTLRVHLSKKHRKTLLDIPIFECTKCNLSYTRISDLNRHNNHHVACDECGKYFPTAVSLQQHKITHGGDEQYECFACHRTFSTFVTMRPHTKYCFLAAEEKIVCAVCQKELKNPSSLRRHMERHEGRTFTCDKCNRTYSNKETLDQHISSHRKCQVCGIYVLSELDLQRHMIEHIDNYAFECFVCHHRYTSCKQVRMHVRSSHTVFQRKARTKGHGPKVKNHLCPQCGARFTNACFLRMHLMREDHQAGGGEKKPFECGLCKKRYTTITALNDHTRRHTGQNPYKCEICGKVFPCSSSLCEHRQGVHLQKDRYKCTICNYKCYKGSGMKKHMLTHGIS